MKVLKKFFVIITDKQNLKWEGYLNEIELQRVLKACKEENEYDGFTFISDLTFENIEHTYRWPPNAIYFLCNRIIKQPKEQRKMKNPKAIVALQNGASYEIPTYKITSTGVEDGTPLILHFCKGSKDDESALRQEGVFTETLIQTAKQYLESVNVGDLATRETSQVITKLDEALMWLEKRRNDRELRNVLSTYNK